MYFITIKRMLEVCFSAHPNIQYRAFLLFMAGRGIGRWWNFIRNAEFSAPLMPGKYTGGSALLADVCSFIYLHCDSFFSIYVLEYAI